MLWALLIMVLLVVGFIWSRKARHQKSTEMMLEQAGPMLDGHKVGIEGLEQLEEDVSEAESQSASDKAIPPQLIIMRIIAGKNKLYVGYELLQTLLTNNFRFGKMDIFHRHAQPSAESPILFSLASATEPGTFDINNMGSYSCRGLTMFMCLNEHKDPDRVFNIMLQTAQQLVADLGGEIWDEKYRLINKTVMKNWLDKIRSYKNDLYSYDLFAQK